MKNTALVEIEFIKSDVLAGLVITCEKPAGLKVGQVVKHCVGGGGYKVLKVLG